MDHEPEPPAESDLRVDALAEASVALVLILRHCVTATTDATDDTAPLALVPCGPAAGDGSESRAQLLEDLRGALTEAQRRLRPVWLRQDVLVDTAIASSLVGIDEGRASSSSSSSNSEATQVTGSAATPQPAKMWETPVATGAEGQRPIPAAKADNDVELLQSEIRRMAALAGRALKEIKASTLLLEHMFLDV